MIAYAALRNVKAVQDVMKDYQNTCFPFVNTLTLERDKKAKDMLDWFSKQGAFTFKAAGKGKLSR